MTSHVVIDGAPVVVSPAGRRILRDAATGTVLWGEMHHRTRDLLVTSGLITERPWRTVGLTEAGREALAQIQRE